MVPQAKPCLAHAWGSEPTLKVEVGFFHKQVLVALDWAKAKLTSWKVGLHS